MSRIRLAAFVLCCTILSFALPAFAQDALPLTQHYTSSDEKIVFSYPADWKIKSLDDDSNALDVNVGTPEAALDKDPVNHPDDVLAPGDVRVNILSIPKQSIVGAVGLTSDANVADILKGLVKNVSLASLDFGPISKTTLNGFPAAQISFTSARHSDGLLLLIDFGSGLIAGFGLYAAPGELNQWQATAMDIAASITYADAVEPTPEATSEGTSNGGLDLTQTFNSTDGTLNFQYPAEWALGNSGTQNGSSFAFIGSSATAADKSLDNQSSTFESGEVAMQLTATTPAVVAKNLPGLELTDDPVKFLQSLITLDTGKSPYTFGDVSATTVNDLQAARADIDAGDRGQGFVMVVRLGDGLLGAITVQTARGELSQWEAMAAAIIATLSPQPETEPTPETNNAPALDLTKTFTSKDGMISFQYPGNWAQDAINDKPLSLNADIASVSDALHVNPLNVSTDALPPGIVHISILVHPKSELASSTGATAASSMTDVLTGMVRQGTGSGVAIGDVTAVTIGSYTAAQVTYHAPKRGEGVVILLDINPELFGAVVLFAAPGELPQWEAAAQAVAASVVYKGETPPAPTATLETPTSPALDLPETFSNTAGTISLNYPSGWVTEAFSESVTLLNVSMASSQAAEQKNFGTSDIFAPGEVRMQVQVLNEAQLLQTPNVKAGDTPIQILDALFQTTGPLPAGMSISKAGAFSINDQEGALVRVKNADKGDGLIWLVHLNNGLYVVATAATAPGEEPQWSATFQAILESITSTIAPPEATPESTSSAGLDLAETYTADNGAGSLNYPTGWLTEAIHTSSSYMDVRMSNTPAALDKGYLLTDGAFAPGEVQIEIAFLDADQIFKSAQGVTAESTPTEILDAAFQTTGTLPAGTTISKASAITLNDKPAAEKQITAPKGDEAVLLLPYRPGIYALTIVTTASGELPTWEIIAEAIMASAQLSDNPPLSTAEPLPTFAPIPTETPIPVAMIEGTSSNQKVTVDYPADWVTRTFATSGLYLANNKSALNHTLGATFAPGQVQIFVIADTVANLTPQINLGLNSDATAMSLLQASIKVVSSMITTDPPQATTVNGLTAAEVTGHGKGFDIHSTVVELGDNVLGIVQVITAPGEMSQWQDIAQQVLESVAYKS